MLSLASLTGTLPWTFQVGDSSLISSSTNRLNKSCTSSLVHLSTLVKAEVQALVCNISSLESKQSKKKKYYDMGLGYVPASLWMDLNYPIFMVICGLWGPLSFLSSFDYVRARWTLMNSELNPNWASLYQCNSVTMFLAVLTLTLGYVLSLPG